MIIDLRTSADTKFGEYSLVYPFEGRAYKLFKSKPEVPPRRTREGRREIFERQCEAYQRASEFIYLMKHIPSYFGRVTIDDVIGLSGLSTKDDYLLDCCYVTELLDGPEFKVTDPVVMEKYPHISEERRRLENYRIRTMDASVFYADDEARFKFIDFEMES
jgi:hypothetical protein